MTNATALSPSPVVFLTPADHYSAAMNSVDLINNLLAQSSRTDEENLAIARNANHLEIIVTRDFWTTEDLEPLYDAIAAGRAQ